MQMLQERLKEVIFYVIHTILLLIIVSLIIYNDYFKKESVSLEADFEEVSLLNEENKIINDDETIVDQIYYKVDIKGAVLNPGVYTINSDAVVNDVILLAGGLKSNASTKYINLSKRISNEMVINIFTNYEISQMNNKPVETCVCPTLDITSCNNASIIEVDGNDSTSDSEDIIVTSGKVSINNATMDQLVTLTGIGESKAKAIIEYREKNGPFTSIEDITNVSGIGKDVFEKIKNDIEL